MPKVETNCKKVIDRLVEEGWVNEGGAKHMKFGHPDSVIKITVPRHRTLTDGVARSIARAAGWI